MHTKISIPTLVAVAVLQLSTAHAEPWQINAGACTPEDETISGALYATAADGSYVQHETGVTTTVRFICPVPMNVSTGLDSVTLFSSNDGDTSGLDYYVKAELKQMSKATGSTTELCAVTSNSNSYASINTTSCGSLDWNNNIYWVLVRIVRTGTTYTPRFYGLEMYDNP